MGGIGKSDYQVSFNMTNSGVEPHTPTSMHASTGTSIPSTEESESSRYKRSVTFNLNGHIIGNKNPFKNKCLSLVKLQVGVLYDDWRIVPKSKKDDMWEMLQGEFIIPPIQKDNILEQMGIQWKTWKKNLRKLYFGTNRDSILALKDKVPVKEPIPLAAWNEFIEREAGPSKLAQRQKAKENRAKKSDVHCLGRRSYAELEATWEKGVKDKLPDRVELYVHAHKQKKTGEFHPSVTATMEKLTEIQSTQCESSLHSLENDALSQHFGKDKRGRTRVGKVSSTKLKATLPIRNELEKVKAEVQQISSNTSMTNEKMENLATYVKRLVNIYEGKESHAAASGSQTPHNQQNKHNSSSLLETVATPSPSQPKFGAEFYYMKDPLCTKNIAVGTIDSIATTGTVVHHRPMQAWEVKVCVVKVLEGMDNQPLWLGNQGCADSIGEVVGGYVVWPRNLLEKVVE